MSQNKVEGLPELESSDLATRLRRLIPYFLGGFGIFLMAAGIVINYVQTSRSITVVEKNTEPIASAAGVATTRSIKVEASGAVERPGVYDLPHDSRVKDVLITAGGLVAKADRNYISRSINLAQRVVDGTKIYFPFETDNTSNSINQSNSNTVTVNASDNLSALININTASVNELDVLPGIGPATADKIISGRPYLNVSNLLSKKVVSNSVFQKIKDRITVD